MHHGQELTLPFIVNMQFVGADRARLQEEISILEEKP
jgi:hypothetical protein